MVEKKKTTNRYQKEVKPQKKSGNPEMGYITKGGQGKTVRVYDYQTGTSIKVIDEKRRALRPGRRVSRKGNVYYEFRANRSDKNPLEML